MKMGSEQAKRYSLSLKSANRLLNILLVAMLLITIIWGGLVFGKITAIAREGRADTTFGIETEGFRYFKPIKSNTSNYYQDSREINWQAEGVNSNAPKVTGVLESYMRRVIDDSNRFADVDLLPLGEFEVTAYTAGPESTGKDIGDQDYGITASGVEVVEGETIAADWDVIPAGSWVYIENVGYRLVQDKGGLIKGNKVDLYIPDLGQALEWGVQHKQVWLVEVKE